MVLSSVEPFLILFRRVHQGVGLHASDRAVPQAEVEAWREVWREGKAETWADPPLDRTLDEAVAWMERAQDNSRSCDGGVARHYSLASGWGTSYPETTGYIIPTLLLEARIRKDATLLRRAQRMLEWLVEIQLPCGAYQGGTIDARPVVPVTFNTGQILLGLAAGVEVFGDRYRQAMNAAAQWLVRTQDADGCWRRYPTPFAKRGIKAYETHVSWGLFEAERLQPGNGYGEAAIRNIRWALSQQAPNGWFSNCCLDDVSQPLTHTIGYVLRGIVEAYRFTGERSFLLAALRTAEGLLGAMRSDGYLAGRLNADWQGAVESCCLTGTEQIALSWLMLYRETGDLRFRNAAFSANRYVRSTVRVDGPPETRGAVKGSMPITGDYGRFEYLNWACKFFIDANRLEKTIREEESELAISNYPEAPCFADSAASGSGSR